MKGIEESEFFGRLSVRKLNKDSTRYEVFIWNLGQEGIDAYGGRYLVNLVSPAFQSYFFNEGEVAPGYVRERFPEMGGKDAENVAFILNEYFKGASGGASPSSRIVEKSKGVFEITDG